MNNKYRRRHPGIPNKVEEYPGSIENIFIRSRISPASLKILLFLSFAEVVAGIVPSKL